MRQVHIKKISFRKVKLLQVPKIEIDIQQQLIITKKKQRIVILIGCMVTVFVMRYIGCVTGNYLDSLSSTGFMYNADAKNLVDFLFSSLMSQSLTAFIVDLISLTSSLIFSTIVCLLGIIINIVSISFEINQGLVIGQILNEYGLASVYMSAVFMLYDSSYELQIRFNNAAMLHTFSLYIPTLLSILQVIFQINNKSIVLITNFLSGILFLIGIYFIYISYLQLETQRQQSKVYQSYLRYQGVGITFNFIKKYYSNYNVLYLLVIQFTFSLFTSIVNPSFFNQALKSKDLQIHQLQQNIMSVSNLSSCILLGVPIVLYINSRKWILKACMNATKNFLIASIISSVIIYIIISLEEYLSYNFLYVMLILMSVLQGSMHLATQVMYKQVLTCIYDERSSIKCLGYALISIVQDSSTLLINSQITPKTLVLLQLSFLILSQIYSCKFLKHKSFNRLECVVKDSFQEQQKLSSPFLKKIMIKN